MAIFGKAHGLIVAAARCLSIIEKAIAVGQALPNVGMREQTPVLCVFCQLNSFVGVILRQARVAARLSAIADAFLYTSVLDHASHHPRSCHEDMVSSLLAEPEGGFGCSLCMIQVSII